MFTLLPPSLRTAKAHPNMGFAGYGLCAPYARGSFNNGWQTRMSHAAISISHNDGLESGSDNATKPGGRLIV